MIDWNYDPKSYTEKTFSVIPEGDHRCRIEDVTFKTFKSGNQGFEITLAISGQNSSVWHYLILNRSNPEMTNQNLGSFFASFGITDTNLNNYTKWIGKIGACRIKHEEYNGDKTAKVRFFISPEQVIKKNLPAWIEPSKNGGGSKPATNDGFQPVAEDDVPF